MQEQVVWSMNFHNDDNQTDCFSYIVEQCNLYIKTLCKPWTSSIRKKKKQNSSACGNCETIDVISLFQSNPLRQESFTILSKPQISRSLLKSLVTKTDPIMPLAQNYKDDVSLLESETALSKGTMNRMNTEFPTHQENDGQTNPGNNLSRNGISSNIIRATTASANSYDMLADDDLPEIVSVRSTVTSGYNTVNRIK